MSWYVSRDLRLAAPFIVHTQNGDAACETAAFIGTLKSVLRSNRLLVHIVNNNRKSTYEILQCYVSAM